ncbi:MAG: DUF3473 domain-containing protein [Burkholderiaceae bacterium]|nr:DUF3473 domain-containing protein [Burkholderiaceae bacterium]
MVNAFTVDVEDYFQVAAFADVIERSSWDSRECRVEANVERLLELLAARGVHATFFTLGWIAERYPALVRRIVTGGHELANHGHEHRMVSEQTPEEFRADLARAKATLEDIGGAAVKGYRAPSFSIGAQNMWAHDMVAETGHRYSSSIYPVKTDLYGSPDAPRFAYRAANGLLEIPPTSLRAFGRNFPASGGGYFRLLPYQVSRRCFMHVNHAESQPAMFYCHPWEIDPGQPRVAGARLKSRLRHYLNLQRTFGRIERLLTDFAWDRVDRVFGEQLGARS